MNYNKVRIEHAEAIERTVDGVIDTVMGSNNVATSETEETTPVSSETWLAVKAKVLALLAEIMGE